MNTTGTTINRVSLVGANMTQITTDLFSLGVSLEVVNGLSLRFFVLPPVNDTAFKTTLYRLSVYVVIFNYNHFNQAGFAAWAPDTWRNINTTTTLANSSVFDQSTLVGLRWFSFTNNPWNIGISYTNHTSLAFSTSISGNYSFGYDVLIMQTLACPYNTAYLD